MPDNRSKAEKLRALYRHPRTGLAERAAAKAALERLGEPLEAPSYRVPPRWTYRPPPPRQSSYAFVDAWYEAMMESLRRAAEAETRRYADAARQAKQVPPCPGCGHTESDHIGIRCYACHPNAQIELAERRAAYCGWMYGRIRNGPEKWFKVRDPGFGGRRSTTYDEWEDE